MNHDTEQMIGTHVAAFVAQLDGRFREHCSDAMLVGVLMHRLTRTQYGSMTFGAAMLAGDSNAAYGAACPVFESILEHHCRAGGNGHHVAQAFCAHMQAALENTKTTDAEEQT